jgi:hypothetical protein
VVDQLAGNRTLDSAVSAGKVGDSAVTTACHQAADAVVVFCAGWPLRTVS